MTKSNMFQKMRASFLFAVSAFSASIAMDTSPKLLSENPKIAGMASLPRNIRSLIYSECRAKDIHTLSLTSKGMKEDIKEASKKNQKIRSIVSDIIICNPNKAKFSLKTFTTEVENALSLFSGLALMCEENDKNSYNLVEFEDLLRLVNHPQITKLFLVHINTREKEVEQILCSMQYARHLKSLFLAQKSLTNKMATYLSNNPHLTYLGLSSYYRGNEVESIFKKSTHKRQFYWIEYEAALLYNYKSLDMRYPWDSLNKRSPMTKFLKLVNVITSLKNNTFVGSPQDHNEALSLLRKSLLSMSLIPPETNFRGENGIEEAKKSVKTMVGKLNPRKNIYFKSVVGECFLLDLNKKTQWPDIYDRINGNKKGGFNNRLIFQVGFYFVFAGKKIEIELKDLPIEIFYDVPNDGTIHCIAHIRGD